VWKCAPFSSGTTLMRLLLPAVRARVRGGPVSMSYVRQCQDTGTILTFNCGVPSAAPPPPRRSA
jgi:hypothetical protein